MTVYLPPPDTNPYLKLLAAALQRCQAAIRTMPVVLSEKWLSTARIDGPSVLHFHWPSYSYTDPDRAQMTEYVRAWAQSLAYAKSIGFKVVWTAHNLYPHEQTHNDLEQEGRQILLDSCDAVIAHCCAGVALLRQHFNLKSRCVVIPHGHYRGVYGKPAEKSEAREKLGLPRNGTVYLFFGQIRAYKGLERLLNIFVALPESVGTLLVAGPAMDVGLARAIVNVSRNGRNVIVHPFFVPDSEVKLYFGAADVLVLPYSDVLTSGTTVLAHSMGRPVIAPALGCLSEMVPAGTGWLYNSDSDNSLREALEMAASSLHQDCSQKCLQFALTKDWPGIAEKTLAMYLDL
jgi:glycosyltransferase involved in cell wall biosynthesis